MNTGPPPHANAEARRRELQIYAGLWYKYNSLFEHTAAPMRQHWEASKVAYDHVVAALAAQPGRIAIETRPYSEIMQHLKSLADICEMTPRSFEDRVRVCFAAEEYVRVLTQCVIGHPSRPAGDTDRVLQLVDEMLRRDSELEPLPQGLPRLVHLIPDNPTTRPVTPNNIAYWRANPTALIGNGFIEPDNEAPRAFVVVDYAAKRIRGQCYDVQYEDTGPEIFTLGLEEVLEIVADTRLVTNM